MCNISIINCWLIYCSLQMKPIARRLQKTDLRNTHVMVIFVVYSACDPPRLLCVVRCVWKISLGVHAKTYCHGRNVRNRFSKLFVKKKLFCTFH